MQVLFGSSARPGLGRAPVFCIPEILAPLQVRLANSSTHRSRFELKLESSQVEIEARDYFLAHGTEATFRIITNSRICLTQGSIWVSFNQSALFLRTAVGADTSFTERETISRWFKCRNFPKLMTAETKNWSVVAAAMEAQGATNSEMYRRAKAMAQGKADPMPTSCPAAPHSISIA